VAVTAAVVLALAPAPAHAECISSTPRAVGLLSPDDWDDSTGGAADIAGVTIGLDSACRLSLVPNLRPFLPLLANQYLVVQFARDPAPANPGDELVDVEVYVFGDEVLLDDGRGIVPLPRTGVTGFTVTLDQLGLTTSPTQLGIGVVSVYDATLDDPFSGDEVFGDFHPNAGQFLTRIPVTFTQPVRPAGQPAGTSPPPPTVKQPRCVVPKLRRLTVRKAKAALKKAGCRYRVRGKGRIRSFTPKAGTATDGVVRLKAKRRHRRPR